MLLYVVLCPSAQSTVSLCLGSLIYVILGLAEGEPDSNTRFLARTRQPLLGWPQQRVFTDPIPDYDTDHLNDNCNGNYNDCDLTNVDSDGHGAAMGPVWW